MTRRNRSRCRRRRTTRKRRKVRRRSSSSNTSRSCRFRGNNWRYRVTPPRTWRKSKWEWRNNGVYSRTWSWRHTNHHRYQRHRRRRAAATAAEQQQQQQPDKKLQQRQQLKATPPPPPKQPPPPPPLPAKRKETSGDGTSMNGKTHKGVALPGRTLLARW